jgi:hypothetical protein
MFTPKINLPSFISEYKNKISVAYNQTKLIREEKYSQLLQILASAGNDFDSVGEEKLAQQTSQILEILTSNIHSEKEIINNKIASRLEHFQPLQDIIEFD